jgi:hypothetical protein
MAARLGGVLRWAGGMLIAGSLALGGCGPTAMDRFNAAVQNSYKAAQDRYSNAVTDAIQAMQRGEISGPEMHARIAAAGRDLQASDAQTSATVDRAMSMPVAIPTYTPAPAVPHPAYASPMMPPPVPSINTPP